MKVKLIQKIYNLSDIINSNFDLVDYQLRDKELTREFVGENISDFGVFIIVFFKKPDKKGGYYLDEYHLHKELEISKGVYSWITTLITPEEMSKSGFDHPVIIINTAIVEED